MLKRVRYSTKLAEKFSVYQNPVMFMNDFDNFNESVGDKKDVTGYLLILASDVRLKIFADAFA